jgi:hypothetical protein
MEATLLGTDHAALQRRTGTMPPAVSMPPRVRIPVVAVADPQRPSMTPPKPREFFIQGLTLDGKPFRPSDWAERLAGAMACFRPEGSAGGIAAYIGYSPYCVPTSVDGVKCVIVSEALRDIEIMAWDFVMNFARDNKLQVAEACMLPDPPKQA